MTIPTTDWKPSSTDVYWQESLLRVMKDGAVWGVPASESSFKFDKTNMTFCLIAGDPDHETNRRIAKILRMLNYREVSHKKEKNGDDI